MRKRLFLAAASLVLALGSAAHAQQPAGADVRLSPPLRSLLQQEMREVANGTQALAIALASADWKVLHDTSARIRASYILEKKLTPVQKGELERALPAGLSKWMRSFMHVRKSWRSLPKPATGSWLRFIFRA